MSKDYEKGTVFNNWTIIERVENKGRDKQYLCKCKCGTVKKVVGTNMKNGRSLSCGCASIEASTTHGASSHPLFDTWRAMIYRCYNKNNKSYENYGGRGVKVCDEWKNNPHAFFKDMGNRPKGHSLDRIDVDGDYEPSNCRWANWETQAINKRNTGKHGVLGVVINRHGKYVLTMARCRAVRTSKPSLTTSSLKELRKRWDNEYDKNPSLWVKNTLEKNYDREIDKNEQ